MATEFTVNYNLAKPDFNISPWHDDVNNNFSVLDAVLFTLTGFGNVKGVWANDTAYTEGDRVVDDTDGTTWRCLVSHTSGAAPQTFAQYRAANPTHWEALGQSFGAAVQWQTGVTYSVNDFLIDAGRYGVAVANYTSGASYNADVLAGNVITLIDLSSTTQPIDPLLTAISGLTTVADRLIYTTGVDTVALATLTSTARTLLDDTSVSAMRTTLGLGTSATVNTGTSGATIPLLNGANTWSGIQSYSTQINFGSATAASPQDLSRHIALWGTNFGFSITTNQFNMVASSVADFVWYDSSGNERMRLDMSTGNLTVTGTISGVSQSFPAGTKMLFQQTAAPTGWTKDVTHNNKALRVVTGTASSGGSTAFTSVFTSRTPSGTIGNTTATGTVGGTALTVSNLPAHTHGSGTLTGVTNTTGAHTHTITTTTSVGGGTSHPLEETPASTSTETTSSAGNHSHTVDVNAGATASAGSGTTHNHSFTGTAHNHTFTGAAMDFAVQYVDLIIATKD